MIRKSLFFLFSITLLFSCNREKPESGKAQITIEGINISAPSSVGSKLLAGMDWEHPLPTNFSVVFTSQETNQTYSFQISSDFENSPTSIELPLGSYTYESAPFSGLTSTTLPIQFGGNLTVNTSQIKTKLSGVSDFQLLSFQKNNIASPPKSILPQSNTLSSTGDFYYIYVKSNVPSTIEIPLTNGKSFRWGWDAGAFSHNSFYFQKETGDPSPILLSELYFEYFNQVVSLKDDEFPEILNPFRIEELPEKMNETSGLQWIGNRLFSITDGGNPAEIYELQPETGEVLRTIKVSNAPNIDWEDMAASPDFLFIGDFGNNSGNRKDLKVLRIPISSVLNQTQVSVETINFIYQDENGLGNVDLPYDCESMAFMGDKIHLFTKGTDSNVSRIFTLNTTPGNQIAERKGEITGPGKLTGADVNSNGNNLVFIGYETSGLSSRAFILAYPNVISDSNLSGQISYSFFLGSVSKTSQTEGIAIQSSEKVKISGEQISVGGFSVPPRLMELDLKGILQD